MSINLVSAIAVAENVVRLAFDYPVSWTGLLDPFDASDIACYLVEAVSGRGVTAVSPLLNLVEDATGKTIDLTVDRSFSKDVSQYKVTVVNIIGTDGRTLGVSQLAFYGVSRLYLPPDPSTINQSRDMSNPQTMSALLASTGEQNANELGTHPIDNTGDYATDAGLENLKKRVYRRLTTAKGAFLHAPGYGVGIPDQVKRLNSPHVREVLAADAENQISQEPDVIKVRVSAVVDANNSFVVRFFIFIRTLTGVSVKYDVPFAIPSA